MKKKCIVDNCNNIARLRRPTCVNCGASLCSWQKRRPAEILERRRKLNLYDSRMATLVDKVVPLRRKA